MKGRKLIFAAACLLCLTGCGAKTTNQESAALQPLDPQYASEAGDEMPDGTYAVAFESSDLEQKDDGYALKMEFFDYDRYSKEDALALKEGSVIHVTVSKNENGDIKNEHQDVTIDSVKTSKDETSGEVNMIELNGGLENGGVELDLDPDFDVFVNRTMDDYPIYYSIGTGTIPVSKDLTFQDCYDIDTLPDGVITGYENLPGSLEDAQEKAPFNCYAMEAVIRDGELVQLIRNWTP